MSICESDQQKKAAENRRNFPFAAACLDLTKAAFGDGCKLVWASENGAEIGRKLLEGVAAVPYVSAASLRKGSK